jgi:hypothetical protein
VPTSRRSFELWIEKLQLSPEDIELEANLIGDAHDAVKGGSGFYLELARLIKNSLSARI